MTGETPASGKDPIVLSALSFADLPPQTTTIHKQQANSNKQLPFLQ
jgi:hypothetical protein